MSENEETLIGRMRELKVGDDCEFVNLDSPNLRYVIYNAAYMLRIKVTVKKLDNGGYRVLRTQ